MYSFWVCFVLVSSSVGVSQQKGDFTEYEKLYQKSGNVSFVGVFEDRLGGDCSLEAGRGLEEVATVIWTVEALNKYQYLPGISIGATLFGICENLTDQNGFLTTLEEHLKSNENNNYIGALTSGEINQKLPQLEQFFNGNLFTVHHVITTDVITDATVQLLINLQWMNVSQIISDSVNTLKSLREKASAEGIFIQDELLISDRNFTENPKGSVSVVIASFTNISKYNEKLQEESSTLILTPTDFFFDVSLLDLRDAVVSLPPIGDKTVLSGFIKTAQHGKEFFGQKPPTKGPLFIGTAGSVLKLLKPVKMMVGDFCKTKHSPPERPCALPGDLFVGDANLQPRKSMKISPDDVEETLKVLKIEPTSNEEMFLFITSVINGNTSEDFAIFQISALETKTFHPILIMINDYLVNNGKSARKSDSFEENWEPPTRDPVVNLLQKFVGHSGEEETDNFTGEPPIKKCDGQIDKCSNHTDTTDVLRVSWRSLTWVSINTSLGFVGITCTLSTMLFVVIRLCKDDILEGSPCFILLLMVAVVFMYFSSFPFHFEFSPSDFICSYRINGPPTVFAVLFSLLLSRSLLLAFSESTGGFVTHINGYLQSILCFFMIAVQVSIICQNGILSTVDPNCSDLPDKYKIILSLGYDFLLLILLACVSPFIIRSKQNYKEGLLFSISAFFITVVWSAWISFYVLLPNEHKDAAVAIGLNLTASVLLFCIFIPQTYFMSAPFPPTSTLSPLNGNILRDVNFKSTQALNESAFGTITYRNSEMGVSNPNFLTPRTHDNPITRETVIDESPDTSQPN